ncbi:MAG TPA: type II toxin-antitoxin system RelE/ParE family toxin [Candidatus Kapabacteria bacterium]|nr:type II toxin-antitoxin system RelE/ParE family toxin [Candidatus Kapabacteria bacterium]
MNVRIKKTFLKDRDRLLPEYQSKVDELVFEILPKLNRLADLPSVKYMKGHTGYFRVRIGAYRVGIESRGDEIVVHRVLNRREIYRYFP